MRFCALRKIVPITPGWRQPVEDPRVLEPELVALRVQQLLPGVLIGNDLLRPELSGGALVRHLEEEQVSQLLDVLDDTDPVVAQDVTVRPELVHQAAGIRHVQSSPSLQVIRLQGRDRQQERDVGASECAIERATRRSAPMSGW